MKIIATKIANPKTERIVILIICLVLLSAYFFTWNILFIIGAGISLFLLFLSFFYSRKTYFLAIDEEKDVLVVKSKKKTHFIDLKNVTNITEGAHFQPRDEESFSYYSIVVRNYPELKGPIQFRVDDLNVKRKDNYKLLYSIVKQNRYEIAQSLKQKI